MATGIIAIVNWIKDWDAHKTSLRRWAVLFCILIIMAVGIVSNYLTIKENLYQAEQSKKQHELDQNKIAVAMDNFNKISTELKLLKQDKQNGDVQKWELTDKISDLQRKIDESQDELNSRSAALTFSFVSGSKEPVHSISLPVKKNVVRVDFNIWNDTNITANSPSIMIYVCKDCKIVKEADGFNQVSSNKSLRELRAERVLARSNSEKFSTDIEVPATVTSVPFAMSYSCINCKSLRNEKEGLIIGTINLLR